MTAVPRWLFGPWEDDDDAAIAAPRADLVQILPSKPQQRLKFQNALFKAQAETTIDGILAVTTDGRILLANRRYRELWNISEETLAGGFEATLRHAGEQVVDAATYLSGVARLDEVPDETTREELIMKDGRVLDRYTAPLRSDDGTHFGRICYFRDVTALRRTTEALHEWKERYEAAIEATGQVLFDWHIRTNSLTWSGNCEALLGYSARELEGNLDFAASLIHPEDRAVFDRTLARCCEDRSPFHLKMRMRHKDGTYIHVEDDGRLFRGADSQRMVGFLVDVSERTRAEQALANSERFNRAIVDALTSALAILDASGEILKVNAAWHHFVQDNELPHGSLWIGANYLEACDGATGENAGIAHAAAEGIRSVASGKRPEFYLEFPCYSAGTERWFAMRVTRFDAGCGLRLLLTHEDITGRRNAERLEREKVGLREAVAGMEQVLGVVGHELRTPLASLRAISEFLVVDGARDTAEWDRFLNDIGHEVDRMAETVNNLLEAARLNSGRARWNWGHVDVRAVCQDAIESIRPLVNEKRVALTLQVEPQAATLSGDAEALRRLVSNLLSNARKHTTDGRISIIARADMDKLGGRWVTLVVSDTGSGIPPKVLDRLGEAFALNSGVVGHHHVSGTGLGLAICKGIVAAHGGELDFDSIQGVGTTVTAYLCAGLDKALEGDTVFADEHEQVNI